MALKIFSFLCMCFLPLFAIEFSETEQTYIDTHPHIKVCVDPIWPPFEVLDQGGNYFGIAADLLKLISTRTGIQFDIVNVKTWEESVQKVKSKYCDIQSFVNQTQERSKYMIFTDVLFEDPNVFITRQTHSYIANAHTLAHETIAIPEETSILENFKKDFPNLKILPVVTEEDAIDAVENQKADMTVRSLIVAAYTIKKGGYFNLKIAGQPYEYKNQLRIGVQKENDVLRDILSKGIRTITNEEKDMIINKHISIVVDHGISKYIIVVLSVLLSFIGIFVLWNYSLRKKVELETQKRLNYEKQLMQIMKEAEIGKILGNISHQWRQPLTQIGAINLEILLKSKMPPTDNDPLKTYQPKFEDIAQLVDFMSITMRDFLNFYKPKNERETFSVFKTLEQAQKICEVKIKQIRLEIDIVGNKNLMITGYPNHLIHAWINFIDNTVNAAMHSHITQPVLTISLQASSIVLQDNCKGLQSIHSNGGLGLNMTEQLLSQMGMKLRLFNRNDGLCVEIIF